MAGLARTIAVFWALLIFCVYSAVSIDPELLETDIISKINLPEDTFANKYYDIFMDYMKQTLEFIDSLGHKVNQGIDYIIEIADKIHNNYWFRLVQGYFVTGIPQDMKVVVHDFKESRAVEDAENFFVSWFWNPVRNINLTETAEGLKENLRNIQESDALRRPHVFLGQSLIDAYRWVSGCCCRDTLLRCENCCGRPWSERPMVTRLLWFIIGFVSCYVFNYFYNYAMELKEEFDTYEEFLEAVKNQEYPLDAKNNESYINRELFDEAPNKLERETDPRDTASIAVPIK